MWPEEKNPEVWKLQSNMAMAVAVTSALLVILFTLIGLIYLIHWTLS